MRSKAILGLFISFLVAGAAIFLYFKNAAKNISPPVTTEVAVPEAQIPEPPLMTPVPVARELSISKKSFVEHLNLKTFEAAAGDLSLCGDDQKCLKYAQRIKSWVCVAAVCDGTDTSRNLMDCFKGAPAERSKEQLDQVAAAMCSLMKSPSPTAWKTVLAHIPDAQEGSLVEFEAYHLALKGSAASCSDHIKSALGAYGPQWDYKKYKMLSGCRILARETTREQEEDGFYVWLGVAYEMGICSNIVNSEMRIQCSAPETYPALKSEFFVSGYAK